MIKKNWIYFLFGFSVIVYTASILINHKKKQTIESKALYVGNGWGYEIFVDKKIYITQRIIPAIPGKKVFNSQEQAMLVANLVINKLKQKEGLPIITPKELDSLGIIK